MQIQFTKCKTALLNKIGSPLYMEARIWIQPNVSFYYCSESYNTSIHYGSMTVNREIQNFIWIYKY